jgi:hypothetical protein
VSAWVIATSAVLASLGAVGALWYRAQAARALSTAKVESLVAKGLAATLAAKGRELGLAIAAASAERRRTTAIEEEYQRRVRDLHDQIDLILQSCGDTAAGAAAVRAELHQLLRPTRPSEAADGTSAGPRALPDGAAGARAAREGPGGTGARVSG